MYSKIVNPKTGRKVNIKSKLGKTIIQNYINYSDGGASIVDGKSKKKVYFDETAEEWDEKCNKLNREDCLDPENEASFYCKWNNWGKGKCIAIEGDDLEEIYWDEKGEDYYSELDASEKKDLDNYNKNLNMSRGYSSEFVRDNLGLKEKRAIIERQNKGEFHCGERRVSVDKCGPYNPENVWEHPCLDSDGYCYDEDWVDGNRVIQKGISKVLKKS